MSGKLNIRKWLFLTLNLLFYASYVLTVTCWGGGVQGVDLRGTFLELSFEGEFDPEIRQLIQYSWHFSVLPSPVPLT